MTGPPRQYFRPLRTIWLTLLLASLAAIVLCTAVVIVSGGFQTARSVSRITAVAAVLPVGCAFGLLAATVVCRRQLASFMVVSMAATVSATVGWAILIYRAFGPAPVDTSGPYRAAGTATIIGVGLAVMGYLLTSPHRQKPLVITRTVVLVSGTTAGAAALLLLWSRFWQRHTEVLIIALGLGLVGTATGFLALLVVRSHLRSRARASESLPRRVLLSLVCPKCRHEQSLPSGRGRCARCGLALLIEVEEPRCECGYLLYQLEGDSCPECGRSIPRISPPSTSPECPER